MSQGPDLVDRAMTFEGEWWSINPVAHSHLAGPNELFEFFPVVDYGKVDQVRRLTSEIVHFTKSIENMNEVISQTQKGWEAFSASHSVT